MSETTPARVIAVGQMVWSAFIEQNGEIVALYAPAGVLESFQLGEVEAGVVWELDETKTEYKYPAERIWNARCAYLDRQRIADLELALAASQAQVAAANKQLETERQRPVQWAAEPTDFEDDLDAWGDNFDRGE